VEPLAPQPRAESAKLAMDAAQNTPPKVDYATDLFNMLSMDVPNENGSESPSRTTDDNLWAGFQCMFVSLLKNDTEISIGIVDR